MTSNIGPQAFFLEETIVCMMNLPDSHLAVATPMMTKEGGRTTDLRGGLHIRHLVWDTGRAMGTLGRTILGASNFQRDVYIFM